MILTDNLPEQYAENASRIFDFWSKSVMQYTQAASRTTDEFQTCNSSSICKLEIEHCHITLKTGYKDKSSLMLSTVIRDTLNPLDKVLESAKIGESSTQTSKTDATYIIAHTYCDENEIEDSEIVDLIDRLLTREPLIFAAKRPISNFENRPYVFGGGTEYLIVTGHNSDEANLR